MSLGRLLIIQSIVGLCIPAAQGQLPPTNMGKYVHQPGDNQYSQATQLERHPVYQAPRPNFSRAGLMPVQAPRAPQVDPSIEPIACDEPIPPALFPPLPDRLDLPISSGSGSWTKSNDSGRRQASPSRTMHQGYQHVSRPARTNYRSSPDVSDAGSNNIPGDSVSGSFLEPGGGGAGGGNNAGDSTAAPDPYRVRTNRTAPRRDLYRQGMGNSQYGGTEAPPKYTGASERELKALGNEPKLSDKNNQDAADAPSSIVVTQSATQDLSLPEDDQKYTYRPASKSSGMGKSMGKGVGKMMRMVPMGF